MDELRLRSRSVSELVDASFALYRRDAGQYMLLVAISYVPTLLAKLLLPDVSLSDVTAANPAMLLTLFWTSMVTLAITLVTYAFAYSAVMKYGSNVYLGEHADIESTISHVLPRLLSVVFATFLKGLLFFLGFICLFVGALYVAARWFAVLPAIILENKDPIAAFGRSSELTEGRKRHVLNALLLVWIIYFLLAMGIGLIAGAFKSPVISLSISTVYAIVAMPVLVLTSTVLYYDCRIRGEGFDLEHMAAAMDRAGAAQ